MTTTSDDVVPFEDEGSLSIEQLVRRQGVKPRVSVAELAQPGLFESDEEYEQFLADLYACRHAGT